MKEIYSYYTVEISPTEEALDLWQSICKNFAESGEDRVLNLLSLSHWNEDVVVKTTNLLSDALAKMKKEYQRFGKFGKKFILEFATDYNDYFSTIAAILRKMRSHMAPWKAIHRKMCKRKHPNKGMHELYNIQPKSVYVTSALGEPEYQRQLFGIDDPSMPQCVRDLYDVLSEFIELFERMIQEALSLIEEEKMVKNDPQTCMYILQTYKKKAHKKYNFVTGLIDQSKVEERKKQNPSYQKSLEYKTEEEFAQNEYHKHTTRDMNEFCLIQVIASPINASPEENALWGNNNEMILKMRKVVANFDSILPKDMKEKLMTFYIYCFCKWATQYNIKGAYDYFKNNYKGKHQVKGYGAVNKRNKDFLNDNMMYKQFVHNIDGLFKNNNHHAAYMGTSM